MGDGTATVKPVSFADSQASVLLDLIRGLAAVLVLLSHTRNLLFVDFPEIGAHRIWFLVPYLLTSAGHQSVIVFFVLSGFLIGGSIFRSLASRKWSWPSYLAHRFTRLWIVLLPGLLSCLLLDRIGRYSGLAPRLYAGQVKDHVLTSTLQNFTAPTFLGNLFFLQGIRVPYFGSNSALWSLANEFWYYLLFPLLWLTIRHRPTTLGRRILYLVLIAAIAWLLSPRILLQFPIWLVGALLALLPAPAPSFGSRLRLGAAALYVPLFFIFERVPLLFPSLPFADIFQDYGLALLTCGLLWISLSATDRAQPTAFTRFARQLSRFSFTLYVIHLPVMVLATAVLVGERRWYPSTLHLLAALLAVAVAILYAFTLARVTEFRTNDLRMWIEQRLHITAKPRAEPATAPASPSASRSEIAS